MLSTSRCSNGWSIIKKLDGLIIERANISLTFSPPEVTLTFLNTASALKSILPKNPRIFSSSFSLVHWLIHNSKSKSLSKNDLLSKGKYSWVIVAPHFTWPWVGLITPARISKSLVLAISLIPRRATFSFFSILKFKLANNTLPSFVVNPKFSTAKTCFPDISI